MKMLDESMILLRHALHACPEVSGKEEKTKAMLMDFLKTHTTMELYPCGDGFYAAHRETAPYKPSLALRADYDALALTDGTASHLCGHDGHAAALCGTALFAEGKTFDRNIFFLFQPAEETGAGAEGCTELLHKESVAEIYGAHNLPGFPMGQVVTRPGTFACASRGVTLTFRGRPTHAAYPENGVSPAAAVGELLCALPSLSNSDRFSAMTLCTVIGVQMGEKAFGAAAACAEVWLTLRAEHDRDLCALNDAILHRSIALAEKHGLAFPMRYRTSSRQQRIRPPVPKRFWTSAAESCFRFPCAGARTLAITSRYAPVRFSESAQAKHIRRCTRKTMNTLTRF